ncbi:Flagellar basal body rod protein FlgG OS=uncultured planctomycete GN=HGMM_F33C03C04 PE=4 SV=1 [Gemmata massiliana]|uniref:Flagellar basal body rod protein FlgG n=1 Tax=Gemmata massiliana TaxID=1210884 RepID=A0A6P2CW91_9BACT|nr:flagellar basal body rod protein FlgG [Gemmata massiliana]VTR93163.1 Flagellar basal body rod protein FlgG OS=uncultured planctomycete GN=HGMM_F33C03C04 PE=4 SV=1 [Gemmata massiliana]
MSARVLFPALCLTLGLGYGLGSIQFFAPTIAAPGAAGAATVPAPVAAAEASDEAVVEVRLRLPKGGSAAGVFAKDSPSLPPGTLVNTQKSSDIAIEGDGFFQITLPNGDTAYTRVGNFGVAADGGLVTAQGYRVSPQIKVPPQAVSFCVGSDGTVSVQQAGALNASTVLGQLTLVKFPNPGWMKPGEHGLFRETERSGTPLIGTPGQNGLGFTRQGFRERHSFNYAAALIELVRDLENDAANNGEANKIQVKVKPGKE